MVIEEATKQFHPLWKQNAEKTKILEQYCDEIDKISEEFDGISFEVIVDNKSRDLKPRSGRATPTARDKELDDMLKQLYLYSAAVFQEFGKYPKELCFNCFRTGTLIREPFDIKAYNRTIKWAKERIKEISEDTEFSPNRDFFACRYICGVSDNCIYDIKACEERRKQNL